MALANYTDLQTAVASWMKRTDLTSVIPDFISLGESKINADSRTLHQETTATITMTIGQEYDSLPSGFNDVIDFYYTDDPYEFLHLQQTDLKRLNEDYKIVSTTQPHHFAITNRIEYDAPPDKAYVTRMHYSKRWDLATDTTNWLMTNHPNVYLYRSLAEAELYAKNDSRVALWEAKAEQAMNDVNWVSSRTRGNAPLMVDKAMRSRGYGNIYVDNY